MTSGGPRAGEENSIVRKQLKVKLRLGDINKLEEGVVDSGSSCNLLPMSYCLRHGICYQTRNKVREIVGFNGSRSEVMGQVELRVKIGQWTEQCTFLVTSELRQIILGLPLLFKLNLLIHVVGDRLTNNHGHSISCHLVFVPNQKN